MKPSTISKAVLTLFCLFIPVLSFCQSYFYRNPFIFLKQYNRLEVGYSIVTGAAELSGNVPVYSGGNYLKDSLVKRTVNSGAGMGISFGVTLPVVRLGQTASVVLSIHLLANTYQWKGLNQVYDNGTLTDLSGVTSLNGTTQHYAAPISVDFKMGSDALAIRARTLGLSLGGGVMPHYNATTLQGYGGSGSTQSIFSTTPFVMGEFSIYMFECFRVRAYYTLGNYQLYGEGSSASGGAGSFKLTGTNSLILSVTVLPLSYQWAREKKGWWNDYDTELPFR